MANWAGVFPVCPLLSTFRPQLETNFHFLVDELTIHSQMEEKKETGLDSKVKDVTVSGPSSNPNPSRQTSINTYSGPFPFVSGP
jgi:hypothetical protein